MHITYEAIKNAKQELLEKGKRKFAVLGYLKLALLILFAVSLYFMVKHPNLPAYKIEAAALLAAQIIAWAYHAHLGKGIDHAHGIIAISQRHLHRIYGTWTVFKDTGEEFADPEHPYGNDLDIVGKKSLFQYLNVTHTWHGRQAFAHDLLHAQYTEDEIKQRQEAVEELSADSAFACELEYQFSRIDSNSAAEGLVSELKDNQAFMHNKTLRVIFQFGPLLVLLFVGFVAVFRWQKLYVFSLCLYTIQALVWLATLLSSSRYLKGIHRLPFKLKEYSNALAFVDGATFKSERLRQIQDRLASSDLSAVQATKALAKISDKAGVRSNPIIYFILNVLFLWDLECAFLFEDWKKEYAPHCEHWFLALGELESLSCFAVLRNVCTHTCFPSIAQQCGVEAKEIGHPLILNETRVTNPLKMQEDITIVSGSNMSGKTTYLRTVGINIILARAGSPVCAKEMALSDFHVITSMRLGDDLNEGISTFYAELRRIKGILDAAQNARNTLFLVDEIFRGTNSVDRLSGARTVMTRLSHLGVSGMITTHDLELCDLERALPNVKNHHFSEQYRNGQIHFDYKIKPGKSTTTNATYLMEMVGIVSDGK